MKPPLIVAHRGANAQAPENTLAAFRRALELRAPAVECDVHLTRDDHVVVIHDGRLGRTVRGLGAGGWGLGAGDPGDTATQRRSDAEAVASQSVAGTPLLPASNRGDSSLSTHHSSLVTPPAPEGEVGDRTFADLRHLDAGGWFGAAFAGQPIPELGEVLDLVCVRGRLTCLVELKTRPDGSPYDGLEDAVAAVVRNLGLPPAGQTTDAGPGGVLAISFAEPVLSRLREVAPEIPTGLLLSATRARALGPDGAVARTRALGATWLCPHWAAAADLVTPAHDHGLLLDAWTVNDPEALRALAAAGLDALTTDQPDVALATLRPGT